MTDKPIAAKHSRRDIILLAATGVAAISVGGHAITPAFASSKMSQKDVQYQAKPKGAARCDGCIQWQPPAACKLVTGIISPAGWCAIYAPKPKSR